MNKEEKSSKKCPICGRPTYKESKYCIFHASKEDKTEEDFKKALKKYIQEIKEKDKDYIFLLTTPLNFTLTNFERFIFIGDINFKEDLKVTVFKKANFKGATFEGGANFKGANFEVEADFKGTTFKGYADFSFTTFEGNARFESATFEGYSHFVSTTFNTTFEGGANFKGATFKGNSHFDSATFEGYADFNSANFKRGSYFENTNFDATFKRGSHFENTNFEGEADFGGTTFKGDVNFAFANFKRDSYFENANFKGSSYFENTNFEGEADFGGTTFKGDVNFAFANFKRDSLFAFANFEGEANFKSATFKGNVNFSIKAIKKNISFANALFTQGKTLVIKTPDVKNENEVVIDLKKVYLENVYLELSLGENTLIDFTNALLISTTIEKDQIENHILQKEKKEFSQAQRIYLLLKNNFHSIGRYDDESWAFKKERDMERLSYSFNSFTKNMENKDKKGKGKVPKEIISKFISFSSWLKTKNFRKWLSSCFFNIIYGYGERPQNVILLSIFIIILFSIFFSILGINSLEIVEIKSPPVQEIFNSNSEIVSKGNLFNKTTNCFLDCLYFSAVTFTTLGYGDFRPLEGWVSRICAGTEAFIGALMIALFVYTLARRTGGR